MPNISKLMMIIKIKLMESGYFLLPGPAVYDEHRISGYPVKNPLPF